MKLESLKVSKYRILRDVSVRLKDLNLFIGPNASGKSSILDALRFLQEGVRERDFREPVASRGGIIHLAWKGEDAHQINLEIKLVEEAREYEWSVLLTRDGYEFFISEELREVHSNAAPTQLLSSNRGTGWWWSGEKQRVQLKQLATGCALSAAAADATFPARRIAEFVGGWGFFDPNPYSLRRSLSGMESSRLDAYGRNLAERLYALKQSSRETFDRIVLGTQSVLGLPTKIEPRETDEGRFYFAQEEPGLKHWVHQIGASSGTLRTLALMTALFGESGSNLVGVEEPENHVHPTALAGFAEYLLKAKENVQVLVTTHSPLLLDFLNEPSAVFIVQRDDQAGTRVIPESNPQGVRQALEASGFGLGEFYETKGFGS